MALTAQPLVRNPTHLFQIRGFDHRYLHEILI